MDQKTLKPISKHITNIPKNPSKHSFLVPPLKGGTDGTSRPTFEISSLSRPSLGRQPSKSLHPLSKNTRILIVCTPNHQKFPPAAGFKKQTIIFFVETCLSHPSRPTFQNLALSRPTLSRPSEIGRGNYGLIQKIDSELLLTVEETSVSSIEKSNPWQRRKNYPA